MPAHWIAVTAPNLGTFYRAPKPGAPAFVEIGQNVGPDSELCLIEVMKLFTTLKAGVKGILKRVCAKDAEMVEFGDVLFYIEPT
jgi:acetyl-CoA carboxylase biotin carboxyl carrier protein